MSTASRVHRRRLWFAGLWLTLPWPFIVFGGVFVPAVRYSVLAAASLAIAASEGAAGPVMALVALFTGWAVLTTLLCWLIAWTVARGLDALPERAARYVTLAALGGAVAFALLLDPYDLRFGTVPHGGLLDLF